jgi:hypothetical protein
MPASGRRARLRQLFGTDGEAIGHTFGPGLRPYLPASLATPWHADKPPSFATESKHAWSGRTNLPTDHFASLPDMTPEIASSPLRAFHHMVTTITPHPGPVPARAQRWVDAGCTATLCYVKCWDPQAQTYSDPLLSVLSLPGFPLEPPDNPQSIWSTEAAVRSAPPFDYDDGTTIVVTAQAAIPAHQHAPVPNGTLYATTRSSVDVLSDPSTLYCLEGSRFLSILAAPGLVCENPAGLAALSIASDTIPNRVLPSPPTQTETRSAPFS